LGRLILSRPRDDKFLKEQKNTSALIDAELEKDGLQRQKERHNQYKLIILGPGESGKSTVLKQMKLLHGGGLDSEREQFKYFIHQNICTIIKVLTSAVPETDISQENAVSFFKIACGRILSFF
jgi:guanine nucleotide-binding protein subunit alpha-15